MAEAIQFNENKVKVFTSSSTSTGQNQDDNKNNDSFGSSNRDRSHSKELLSMIESKFLEKLGLKSRPKPKKNFHIPEHMIKLYNRQIERIQESQNDLYNDDDENDDDDIDDDDDSYSYSYDHSSYGFRPDFEPNFKSRIKLLGSANTIRNHQHHGMHLFISFSYYLFSFLKHSFPFLSIPFPTGKNSILFFLIFFFLSSFFSFFLLLLHFFSFKKL